MFLKLPYSKKNGKSDSELLKSFSSSGNPEVLGELYQRYMHLVYGVCIKYLKDREESRDAVMQIFEKLLAELPHQNIDNFGSWLHVVTRNWCLMHIRSKKSSDGKLSEFLTDQTNFMENDEPLHPIDENNGEMGKALEDCISRLKEIQKKCVLMFYYESLCYKDIADSLTLDINKVKSHIQNGKRNLKLCLEEKNETRKER